MANVPGAYRYKPANRSGDEIWRSKEVKSIKEFKQEIIQNVNAVRMAALDAVEFEAFETLEHIIEKRVPRDTGALAESGQFVPIVKINRLKNINARFELIFTAPYAYYVHEGFPRGASGQVPRHTNPSGATWKFMDIGIRDRIGGMQERIIRGIRSRLK